MKILTSVLIAATLLNPISTSALVSPSSFNPDNEAPVITVIDDKMTTLADEESQDLDCITAYLDDETFKLSDHVEVKDNVNPQDVLLMTYGDFDVHEEGEYIVKLIAVDKAGNSGALEVIVKVMQKPKRPPVSTPKDLSYNNSTNENDAYSLALQFIGMGGQCSTVANAFLRAYYGEGANISNCYAVSAADAKPGDIIYYANGGLGIQHYAIYLGGESALHGNWEGSAKIKGVFLNNASAPQFYRCNGY